MPASHSRPTRRTALASLAGAAAAVACGRGPAAAAAAEILTRTIPSTGERIPAVGMGSWITFNVGPDRRLREQRAEVLQAFFEEGGRLIDSSPMYGSSEEVIGYGLERVSNDRSLFAATKVWTWLVSRGPAQMARSQELWGIERFDLIQIHNLLSWEGHLATLRAWKEEGRIRLLGITTSHGRRHQEFEQIMGREPLDTVQFTYNILDREAERRLLPLAADRGMAVIVNRPFRQRALIERFGDQPLPEWAGEFGCTSWAQFFLKFILAHPAVTCVIPATSRVDHMRENMAALHGPLPDRATRERMVAYIESL